MTTDTSTTILDGLRAASWPYWVALAAADVTAGYPETAEAVLRQRLRDGCDCSHCGSDGAP